MSALTLTEFLQQQGLTKKQFGLILGYPDNTASQNVNGFSDYVFVQQDDGCWKMYSERRSFELPARAG